MSNPLFESLIPYRPPPPPIRLINTHCIKYMNRYSLDMLFPSFTLNIVNSSTESTYLWWIKKGISLVRSTIILNILNIHAIILHWKYREVKKYWFSTSNTWFVYVLYLLTINSHRKFHWKKCVFSRFYSLMCQSMWLLGVDWCLY